MDSLYAYNDTAVAKVKLEKLWMGDPKYFRRVKVSPSAAIKMMSHGQSGVEKGQARGSNPVEVMGFLVGRPDTEDLNCIVISDAQPIPAEGFETRVVMEDETCINYMIQLGESNEITKKDR